MNLHQLSSLAQSTALEAGRIILSIYHGFDMEVGYKEDDSPLTKADREAHEVIVKSLKETGIPILSEEGANVPYAIRSNWDYYWLVDPLDGTKEFIKKNGEFTVNIALIHQQKAILGVVYAPVLDWLYWGSKEEGAWKQEGNQPAVQLQVAPNAPVKTIVASRSHLSEETQAFIDQYPGAACISMGSSLKFLLVAEDKAQLYPRFAPTMEWDTAAAQAIVEAAGRQVLTYPDLEPMKYNREEMLNGWFVVK
ncbi:3'(2'),5'-bisphosphate nucleotidase CysQ [Cecembia lonarensis]|uniref:3'(2'),5'-bisphosphate nucleotidase CysQ n=1 Tax=Cecembia lonarensis (strain CCUG 58316 / KCTC 22772 / LW9) TaxID=1225176 RepID=K1LBN5_CECL9|nr:3'(2'),5'-bisphosphate nucleotidase CysQ [Cecembia lonarensis]EKB49657.1 3'(2'),5'-bisphosphate nucleotidase CysQ [Cecembia lonarensis LW9]